MKMKNTGNYDKAHDYEYPYRDSVKSSPSLICRNARKTYRW